MPIEQIRQIVENTLVDSKNLQALPDVKEEEQEQLFSNDKNMDKSYETTIYRNQSESHGTGNHTPIGNENNQSTPTKKTMRTLLHEGYSVPRRGCRTGLEEWSRAVEAWPLSF